MLSVKNLSIQYNSTNKLAVDKVSFDVNEGMILALLGPSGCGKTTILNAISGLLDESQADIQGIIRFSTVLKPVVTTVFQEPRLLPWRRVLRNVSYGLEARGERLTDAVDKARTALKMVGLEDYEDYYPHQLSIGMAQRVNLTLALVCNPSILLLDEPFSALDVEVKESIQEQFKEILRRNNTTGIFVTHNVEEAFLLADSILTLSESPATVKQTLNKKDFKNVPDEAVNELIGPFE